MNTSLETTAPATSPDPDLTVGQQVGEYVVEAKIGQGGFGAVFRATHPVIGKVVALKVLARRFSVDPEMVERFVAEARAVNQIRHRNIIDIFSFGQLPDGRHYYAMEYLEGEPLDAIIGRDGAMPLAQALPILRAIARALDACHAKGIAHRDLKPANIFIATDPDGDLYPKLLDFGIAKLMGPDDGLKNKTRTGVPMGTPYYMSPEQCRGRDVDHRTDYYAFGILAFELLTGKMPFTGDDFMSILMSQISDPAPRPSSLVPSLPAGVDDAILWLVDKEPAARPPNLMAAMAALEAAAHGSGIEFRQTPLTMPAVAAMPSTIGEPLPPTRSKLPLVLGVVTAVGIAVVAIVIATRGGAPKVKQPVPPVIATAPLVTPPAPIDAAVPDAAPAPLTRSKGVTITITGVPDGTEVLVRGNPIGTAPGPVQLDRGDEVVVLVLRADGHLPASKPITPNADQVLDVKLKKKSASTTTRPPDPHDKDSIATPSFN
ncbi:MAG: serine/threonine protein kinase [Proteobacteria bacterium]|nr:serine/threonine protein kinase [Pseudomonadota bacterium]